MITGHIDEWGDAAVDYLDGRLNADDKAAVETHLDCCPACASRMAAQQWAINFMESETLQDAPEDLADKVLGSLTPAATKPPTKRSSSKALWARFKPWIPVTATVAAILVGLVAYGLATQPGKNAGTAFSSARSDSSLRHAAGPVEASKGATDQSQTTTAVAGAATATTPLGQRVVIADKSTMVRTIKAATEPVYISFVAPAPTTTASPTATTAPTSDSASLSSGAAASPAPATTQLSQEISTTTTLPSTTTATISSPTTDEIVSQIEAFTGLDQLSQSKSVGGPTFAAYVSRKQLEAFLDLLQSIKSSTKVNLVLSLQPESDTVDNANAIVRSKSEIPALVAHIADQPAVSRYSFTTSTLISSEDQQSGKTVKTPDEDGSSVLVIISVGS